MDNIGLGRMLGVAVGLCTGPAISALKKNKKADEQEDDDEKQYECTKVCPAKALH